MTAGALVYQEFPTAGGLRLFHHDGDVLARILQHFRGSGHETQGTNTLPFEAEDLDTLRRLLQATYPAGFATEGTHGAADTPSYDWMMAMIDSRSVEEIIGAVVDRLPMALIDRIRHLRSYDQAPAKGRKHMCAESLKAALLFFFSHRMPPPTIVETLEGNVMLEWNVAGDRYLCIEFVGDSRIVYFLFILGQTRIKGRLSAAELVDRIPLDAVKGWYYGTTS